MCKDKTKAVKNVSDRKLQVTIKVENHKNLKLKK